jgi:hypothetical protein
MGIFILYLSNCCKPWPWQSSGIRTTGHPQPHMISRHDEFRARLTLAPGECPKRESANPIAASCRASTAGTNSARNGNHRIGIGVRIGVRCQNWCQFIFFLGSELVSGSELGRVDLGGCPPNPHRSGCGIRTGNASGKDLRRPTPNMG